MCRRRRSIRARHREEGEKDGLSLIHRSQAPGTAAGSRGRSAGRPSAGTTSACGTSMWAWRRRCRAACGGSTSGLPAGGGAGSALADGGEARVATDLIHGVKKNAPIYCEIGHCGHNDILFMFVAFRGAEKSVRPLSERTAASTLQNRAKIGPNRKNFSFPVIAEFTVKAFLYALGSI